MATIENQTQPGEALKASIKSMESSRDKLIKKLEQHLKNKAKEKDAGPTISEAYEYLMGGKPQTDIEYFYDACQVLKNLFADNDFVTTWEYYKQPKHFRDNIEKWLEQWRMFFWCISQNDNSVMYAHLQLLHYGATGPELDYINEKYKDL